MENIVISFRFFIVILAKESIKYEFIFLIRAIF